MSITGNTVPSQGEVLLGLNLGRCIDYRKAKGLITVNLFELSRVPRSLTPGEALSNETVTLEQFIEDIVNLERMCRSFPQTWVNPKTGEETNEGRMNLGVVTLNLPRLALRADGDKEAFLANLEQMSSLAIRALKYRVARCCEASPESAPLLFKQGAFGERLRTGDKVEDLFKGGRATVSLGYIGIYEVCTLLFGDNWYDKEEAVQFSVDILKRLKAKCEEATQETGFYFSVYGTPSESLTDRFCRLDKALFGEVDNVTDKGYYTNSFHYDVRKHISPFEKIDFESQYLPYTTGGQINYVEVNVSDNEEALEALWDYAYEHLMYFGVNTPVDKCLECDYKGACEYSEQDNKYHCPDCDTTEVNTVRRLCGLSV